MTGIIHPGLFGVNLLYNQQDEHGQDLIEKGQVLELVAAYRDYGFRYLRWPGGSVTENDACEDPKQFFQNHVKINFAEVLAVARAEGFMIHVVVPTRVWLHDNEGMSRWLSELDAADQRLIATVELGNEYWGKDRSSGVAMTPAEYGGVARKLLPKLRDRLPGIPIFVQNAPHWTGHKTADIHAALAPASLPALTGAVDHWYPQTWAGIEQNAALFAAMRETPARFPRNRPWELNISEWNINLNHNKDGIYGLDLGMAMAAMLWHMAKQDVRWASVWGFHYRHLANKLRGYRASGATYDTAAGTIFKTFQTLMGFEPVRTEWDDPRAVTFQANELRVTYHRGLPPEQGVWIAEAIQFRPVDDERTPNVDETEPGTQQQAEAVRVEHYEPGGYYLTSWIATALPQPAWGPNGKKG